MNEWLNEWEGNLLTQSFVFSSKKLMYPALSTYFPTLCSVTFKIYLHIWGYILDFITTGSRQSEASIFPPLILLFIIISSSSPRLESDFDLDLSRFEEHLNNFVDTVSPYLYSTCFHWHYFHYHHYPFHSSFQSDSLYSSESFAWLGQ